MAITDDELEHNPEQAMTQADDDELEGGRAHLKPEPQRDRWKRALLLDLEGNRKPYTRVSTVAKTLEDQEGVGVWKMRCEAVGFRMRKDLWNIACALRDPEGTDKQEMTRLVKEAAKVGDLKQGANEGTARHKFCEAIEQGTPMSALTMSDEVKRDVEAYFETMARLGLYALPEWTETHATLEGFDYNGNGVSGTFDNVVTDGVDLFVADKKTSQAKKYGKLAWAIQFALYANMEHVYDVATDQRSPMPNLRKDVALLIWLPTGQAKCEVQEVDITRGWEFAHDAVRVRRARWHGSRDERMDQCLIRPYVPPAPVVELPAAPVPTGTQVEVGGMTFTCIRGTGPDGKVTNLADDPAAQAAVAAAAANLVAPLDFSKLTRTDDQRRAWLKQRLQRMSPEARDLVASYWDVAIAKPLKGDDHHHTVAELDAIERWCDEAERRSGQVEDLSADPTVVNARNLLRWFPGTIDEGAQLEPADVFKLQADMGQWSRAEWLAIFADWRDEAIRLGRDFGIKECPTTRRAKLYELGAQLCNLLEGDPANIDLAWAVLVNACSWTTLPDVPFGLSLSLLNLEQVDRALQIVRQTPFLELCYGVEGCPTLPYWRPVGAAVTS